MNLGEPAHDRLFGAVPTEHRHADTYRAPVTDGLVNGTLVPVDDVHHRIEMRLRTRSLHAGQPPDDRSAAAVEPPC
jgi:hypothetical protein